MPAQAPLLLLYFMLLPVVGCAAAVWCVDPSWSEYPLSPYTFANWLTEQEGQVVNLSMDYETLGERQTDATGVFEFWRTMIMAAIFNGNTFTTPGKAVKRFRSTGTLDCPNPTSYLLH